MTLNTFVNMLSERWIKEEAIAETAKGGYSFHPIWGNLITFMQDMDMDR
jgi:hypothetical protein